MVDTANAPECARPAGHMGWLDCPVHKPNLDYLKAKRSEMMQMAATGDLRKVMESKDRLIEHLRHALKWSLQEVLYYHRMSDPPECCIRPPERPGLDCKFEFVDRFELEDAEQPELHPR